MGRPLRVLIVEDRPVDAAHILEALTTGGFDTTWQRVETPDELRAALAAGSWDSVTSAYTMGGFGAPEALSIAREADADVPFLVVSETVGEDAAVALMRAGANDYVRKHELARLAPAIGRELSTAEMRRAKRSAERAAAHWAAVVESSDDAIMTKNLDGILTGWNRAAEQLYGWSAAEAVGRDVSFLIPADKADEIAAILGRVAGGVKVGYFETVRLHRDGRRIDVSMTVSPILDADGYVVGASKSARDLGDRKRADDALRASEERFRTLAEYIPQLVWYAQPDGTIDWYNSRWYEFTGTTFEEMAGWGWQSVHHPAALTEVLSHWKACIATGVPFDMIFPLRGKDGSYRPFLTRVVPLLDADGRVLQWFGTNTDISEQRRGEEALRESEQRFRGAFDDTGVAMVITDVDNRFVRVNAAFAKMLGYAPSEMLHMLMVDVIHPDDRATGYAQRERLLGGLSNFFQIEKRYLHRDGRVIWGLTNVSLIRDSEGVPFQYVGQVQNLTEKKRDEAALNFQHALLRSQSEASPDGILIVGEGHRVLSYNRRFLSVWGLDEAVAARGDNAALLSEARNRAADPDTFFARV